MTGETVRLAQYAAGLRYADLPAAIVVRAREVVIDTVAAAICGAPLRRRWPTAPRHTASSWTA
jgi:2-methylcitrate dehydratase PrpD